MLTLTLHARSRTEEPAGTRPVFVLAKDCCYAVDHVTGEPIWRRSLGLDTPFFPVKVETAVPGLLVFNSNRLSLLLLDRKTGEPIWEQPIDEAVSVRRSSIRDRFIWRRLAAISTRSIWRPAGSPRGSRSRKKFSRLRRSPATRSG